MTTFRLLIKSILYYWRTNLAVLLGVIAGTAVIGGALIVGDSVRGSLRQMSLDRLGKIDHTLTGPRFFREELADALSKQPGFSERFSAVAPALVMKGALVHNAANEKRLAGGLNVYGIDQRLWALTEHGTVPVPENRNVILSSRVADQLKVKPGDEVSLSLELPASIPRDSLLGERNDTTIEISLVVQSVLPDDSKVGRLNLNPNQQLPPNIFVPLGTLQSRLDLEEIPPPRRTPELGPTPGRVNTLFVSAKTQADQGGKTAVQAVEDLNDLLSKSITLRDLGLRVRENEKRDYLSLESEQMILEDAFAEAAMKTAKPLKMTSSPVLVYLANKIFNADDDGKFSRYSIVAGLDLPEEAPFGPFVYSGKEPQKPLGEGDILINDWLAEDLQVQVQDKIGLTYYEVGAHAELPEEERTFTVRGIVKLDGTPADDRGLTPHVKGITDVENFDQWNAPFTMKKVTPRDDAYWYDRKATPKAFVSLETAQNLWRSRYGELTSVRLSKAADKTLSQTKTEFETALLQTIDLDSTGLQFLPVKYQGLQAASGTTDFSGLFVGFSFFLILSATILISLLFRLGIERRGSSVGLLEATGFSPRQIRRLLMTEGLIVVGAGGLLGLLTAVAYAELMVYGLKTWWYGAIGTRFLDVYVTPLSLGLGFAISVIVASLAVWWAMRQLRGLSIRALLSGATEPEITLQAQRQRGKRSTKVGTVSASLSALLLVLWRADLIPGSEAFSGLSWLVVTFFVVGIAMLTAGLSFLAAWLDSDHSAAVRGAGVMGMGRLGMRNAARHRQRSVFTVGLIASATFVIVAVAAGHRNPAAETPDRASGNGGFTLVAAASTSIIYDLNTSAGRKKLNLDFEEERKQAKRNRDKAKQTQAERNIALVETMSVMPFRVKPGEDASCLNIYKTRLPTILGVPRKLIDDEPGKPPRFKFVGAKGENPWLPLTEKLDEEDGVPVYPVFGDMNTLMYSLHKSVGATISVPDEDSLSDGEKPEYKLKIAGMFDGSVFQGVLLMSNENFLKLYPDRDGYEYFLIETAPADADDLSGLLETRLSPFGFDAERVANRLADFLAVQNTYLSTFQTLGGLGLLLGTLGLATVMLRNVLERRSELALLRAVGFQNSSLSWLVLWENAFLLLWGLLAGSVSALLAMTPHLMSIGADVPWTFGALILGGVFLIGMLSALFAVTEAVRTPILESLRSE